MDRPLRKNVFWARFEASGRTRNLDALDGTLEARRMRSGVCSAPSWMRIRLTTGWRKAECSGDADEVLEAPEEMLDARRRLSVDWATPEMLEEALRAVEAVVEGASAARPRLETREPLEKDLEIRAREGGSRGVARDCDEPLEAPMDVDDGVEPVEAVHPHLLDLVVVEGVAGAVLEAAGKEELRPPRRLRSNMPASPSRWRQSRSVYQVWQP